MSDHPIFILLTLAASIYLFRLWWEDLQAWREGARSGQAFPGATTASLRWVLIAIAGALLLVGIETAGEYQLGVVDEQSKVTAVMLLPFICAGFIEEMIFRGFVFYDKKGPRVLWLSIVGASLLFALLHVQYYLEFPEDGGMVPEGFKSDAKSGWTLLILFFNSLWFYYVRFARWNPHWSLIPCIAAHVASNVGVFAVKLAQGYVSGWW
ncbi:MAG: type II CAAX prenyl endopeptidase Rce1 family protein [Opitutales bacterium]